MSVPKDTAADSLLLHAALIATDSAIAAMSALARPVAAAAGVARLFVLDFTRQWWLAGSGQGSSPTCSLGRTICFLKACYSWSFILSTWVSLDEHGYGTLSLDLRQFLVHGGRIRTFSWLEIQGTFIKDQFFILATPLSLHKQYHSTEECCRFRAGFLLSFGS